jgi:hypothetical protein
MKSESKRKKRASWLLGLFGAITLSAAFSADASVAPSTFEGNDGNFVVNGVAGSFDWANLVTGPVADETANSGPDDDSLGQGSKEDKPVPTVVDGSIPNNKSDLQRFFFATQTVSGKSFMYLGWTRANTLGTANIDFEFNQSDALSSNGVTPVRTNGDMLVTFDFSQGGSTVQLGLLRWLDASTPGNLASQCFSENTLPCWGNRLNLNAVTCGGQPCAEGAVNNVVISDPFGPTGSTLPIRTFGEASINLTDTGVIQAGTCLPFVSAFVKSRSSDSFKAEMKDFIAPAGVNFPNCGEIEIRKEDDAGNLLAGAEFTLYANVGTSACDAADDVNPIDTCITDQSGECGFELVPFGDYCVKETATPAGYAPPTPLRQAVSVTSQDPTPATLVFVDPRLFRIITIVCRESDNQLYTSGVSFEGGAPVASLDHGDVSAALELTLCNLGGARFNDLQADSLDPYALEVTIPE